MKAFIDSVNLPDCKPVKNYRVIDENGKVLKGLFYTQEAARAWASNNGYTI